MFKKEYNYVSYNLILYSLSISMRIVRCQENTLVLSIGVFNGTVV